MPLRALAVHFGLICVFPALLALCEAPDRSVHWLIPSPSAGALLKLMALLTSALYQISIAGTAPGPGGATTLKKLLAGDVARTAKLKATWIKALACTLVPLPSAKMMVLALMMLQVDEATAEARGLPTKATQA